ncbi:PQ loop repeat protein [Talaromyces stipitatus ATCC 10500]|uniref:PQ loop repeat protein n=1 Tax=Talaromyces stipitatus (strain ATCC 10500 / CBS 375.48 / QM 6759 / NRRL 1006) TaxID=441959 RepID=B8MD73_TALSN|nr:PQ loop repeat protein [Talaromyces stipitatus ATCC 10500]EED17598.1 PQ loop repeat protein [Talaromyces stipitatus ATCC 10500]
MSGQDIPVAANVLGTIGTVFWCIQLVPQIWHNWRYKKTDGLPASMMLLWALCSVPFGVYMIVQNVNIPLQIQPQIFGFFGFVSWGQILHYHDGYSQLKVSLLVIGSCILAGGIEALLILTLRIPYRKGITWPDLIFGVIAAIMLASGFVPLYSEVWKRRGRVVGVNWVFLSIDSLGALFSLFALAAQGTFDILGGILYIVVFLAEVFIFLSHVIWRFRHRKLLREAKESGKTVDDLLAEKDGDPVDDNEKSNSSVTQTPVDQGVVAGEQTEAGVSASTEDKDLERGQG